IIISPAGFNNCIHLTRKITAGSIELTDFHLTLLFGLFPNDKHSEVILLLPSSSISLEYTCSIKYLPSLSFAVTPPFLKGGLVIIASKDSGFRLGVLKEFNV